MLWKLLLYTFQRERETSKVYFAIICAHFICIRLSAFSTKVLQLMKQLIGKFPIFHTIKLKPTYATQIAICRTTISKAKPMEKAFHWLVQMMLWWSATGWGSREFWWRMELILAPIKSFNQTRTMYQHTVFHRKNVAIVSSKAIWAWIKEVCRHINMTQLISSAEWKK